METDTHSLRYPSFVETLPEPPVLCGVGFFAPKFANNKKFLQVRPGVVYFEKYSSGKVMEHNIQVYNVSSTYLRVYIAFPETKWFAISTQKERNLLPGLSFNVNIKFKPDEDRYYYDTFKVYSQPYDVVFVQMHALPCSPVVNFPKTIKLPTTVIGEISTKVFTMKCQSPIDLEFKLNLRPPNSAVCISPIAGILSQIDDDIEVTVTCQPKSSGAISTDLILTITNMSMEPNICRISGEVKDSIDERIRETTCYKGDEISHRPRICKRSKDQPPQIEDTKAEGTVIEQVITPADLSSPQAVARLLRQKPGKLNSSQVKQMAASSAKIPEAYTRQIKEARFLEEIKKTEEIERTSKLHWQTRLGATAVTSEYKAEIITSRDNAWVEYTKGDQDDSLRQKCTEMVHKCIVRELIDPSMLSLHTISSFSDSNLWPSRLHALQRFIQAARKVTIQCRAQKRLNNLREWRKQKLSLTGCSIVIEDQKFEVLKFDININKIQACPQALFWKQQEINMLCGDLTQMAVYPLKYHLSTKIATVPERVKSCSAHRFNISAMLFKKQPWNFHTAM